MEKNSRQTHAMRLSAKTLDLQKCKNIYELFFEMHDFVHSSIQYFCIEEQICSWIYRKLIDILIYIKFYVGAKYILYFVVYVTSLTTHTR